MRSVLLRVLNFSILVLGLSFGSVSAHALTALGLGADLHLVHGVNTNFTSPRIVPQLFAQFYFLDHFSVSAELEYDRTQSGEGAFTIRDETWTTAVWARYRVFTLDLWSPFVGLGGGLLFDRVTSSYGDTSDRRRGRRAHAGVGTGLNTLIKQSWLIEGEGRVELVDDQRSPDMNLVLRFGYAF